MAATDLGAADDEWELVNDDGFVYKRRKRRGDLTVPATPAAADLGLEEEYRRLRKKRTLMKLREKYQKELDHWEHLSNSLKAMQEKAQSQQLATPLSHSTIISPSPSENSLEPSKPSSRRRVDDLLLRVEAEESVIQGFSNLCEIAEAICNAQEEHMKQSLVDLPIWASSPSELVASLCDE